MQEILTNILQIILQTRSAKKGVIVWICTKKLTVQLGLNNSYFGVNFFRKSADEDTSPCAHGLFSIETSVIK
jgi:hypothetical protein